MDGTDYSTQRRHKTRRRTVRNITVLAALILLLAVSFFVRIFLLPQLELEKMDCIELYAEDGVTVIRTIDIIPEEWTYKADILFWKDEGIRGRAVMDSGESYSLIYSATYDVFETEKYNGYYVRSDAA